MSLDGTLREMPARLRQFAPPQLARDHRASAVCVSDVHLALNRTKVQRILAP